MVEDEDFEKIGLVSSQVGFGAAPIDSLPYLNQDIDRQPLVSTPIVTSVSPGTFGTIATTTTTTSSKPSSTNGPEVTLIVDGGNEQHSYTIPWYQGMYVVVVLEIIKQKYYLTFEKSWHKGIGYLLTSLNGVYGDYKYTINGEEGWGLSSELVRKNDVIRISLI